MGQSRTRRKLAEYQDLVENMNDIIYTTDRDGYLLTLSQAPRESWIRPSGAVGTHYSRWISEASTGEAEQARLEAMEAVERPSNCP